MTQQFKFGDIVRIKETGYTGSVIDFKFGVVVASHGDTSIDTFDSDELELIPHPDTVRLDWLADRDNHIGNVQLPVECVACNLHSLRDAIDMAMKLPEPPKAA